MCKQSRIQEQLVGCLARVAGLRLEIVQPGACFVLDTQYFVGGSADAGNVAVLHRHTEPGLSEPRADHATGSNAIRSFIVASNGMPAM